jgi:uncharacterized protein YjbI with pentapeptide repeats
MANPEHIAIVLKGRQAVDSWLSKNPHARLDLSNANLEGADLSRLNLSGVRMDEPTSEAIYSLPIGERIARIERRAASLCNANLCGANLTHAIVIGTDFSGADLTGANLTEAVCSDILGLSAANFSEAILENIQWTSDSIIDSDHPFLELAMSKGLETARGVWLKEYIERCLAYLHSSSSHELPNANSQWFQHAIHRIHSLARSSGIR